MNMNGSSDQINYLPTIKQLLHRIRKLINHKIIASYIFKFSYEYSSKNLGKFKNQNCVNVVFWLAL